MRSIFIAKLKWVKAVIALVALLAFSEVTFGNVTGKVYNDLNRNSKMDTGEPGIAGVCVSNGKEVVKTDASGLYVLPEYNDMVVFVVKPSGYMTPVDANNLPVFSYIHKPNGSPAEIQRFRGLEPTGSLPASVNFALYHADEPEQFEIVVNGDCQVYNDREISYLRDSFIADVKANHPEAVLCLSMGDNAGDELSLYPRLLSVMGEMGIPVYYVPGNHDYDYDATSDLDATDTYKSHVGAAYFSFNYGKVHFVMLDSIVYPSDKQGGSYNGELGATQMEWLANDIAMVPQDYLIVLSMHIPLVSDEDRLGNSGLKHQVDEREQIYALLEGRKAVTLGGHTHTVSHFVPGDELEGWGQPTPISQIILGAACGSWWSGDMDDSLVPYSYQRCGSPRNYEVFEFNGNEYKDTFKGSLMDATRQMHMGFLTDSFLNWFDARLAGDPNTTITGLDNKNILSQDDLQSGSMIVNFYNGSSDSIVTAQFDEGTPVEGLKSLDLMDPFALANQLYILRGVPGFSLWDAPSFGTGSQYGPGAPVIDDEWMLTVGVNGQGVSTHLWIFDIPDNLEEGTHTVAVTAVDHYGQVFSNNMVFEVTK